MKEKQSTEPFTIGDTTIAPGVVETIITLAAAEVEGVAGVGTAGALPSIVASFTAGKNIPTAGIDLQRVDEDHVSLSLTIQMYYGHRLVEVADNVRTAVADALKGQIGVDVSNVDIYVDGLSFEE